MNGINCRYNKSFLKLSSMVVSCVRYLNSLTPIPLDGDSATIRNFGQNDTNRSRNGKSVVEAPRSQ